MADALVAKGMLTSCLGSQATYQGGGKVVRRYQLTLAGWNKARELEGNR